MCVCVLCAVFFDKISTLEQYELYRRAFERKYSVYAAIDAKLSANSAEFDQLQRKIEATQDERERERKIEALKRKYEDRKLVRLLCRVMPYASLGSFRCPVDGPSINGKVS